MMFRRSKAHAYQSHASGPMALLHADSFAIRAILFLAMSLVFFLFLKITERKIPTGLVPDSTEDTIHAAPPPHVGTRRIP
ncbi:MAG: hypothetical protein Q8922_04825 [Bacteroidota bacterium]|nr:hypothetical protein [Bacteroidota bacterium]MDP4231971.1 hypothetical protein [Bacteroidota bacterium]MDP4241322.1 hypothetical protein [Bacteroidota bacterium]MDP4287243.1 hypothetical protein [Bacteroidota bacterium]